VLTKNVTVILLTVLAEAALRCNFVFWSYFFVIFQVGVDVLYRRRGGTIVKNNYNMPLMLWNLTIYLLPKLLSYMECLRVLYAFMLLDWERRIGFYRNSDNVKWSTY